jgi:hypothetical protein
MANCPVACDDVEIIGNPESSCDISLRRKTPSRLFFYKCSTALPSPVTGTAMAALFSAGDVVASMELANLVINDPTTEDVLFSDCQPPLKVINTREITFEDRNAVKYGTSIIHDYWDYNFWNNKNNIQQQLRYMIGYCDGDVVIPRDPITGQPLTATMLVFLSWQKASQAGGSSIEFKKGAITFQGDPFNLTHAEPAFNWIDAGIVL